MKKLLILLTITSVFIVFVPLVASAEYVAVDSPELFQGSWFRVQRSGVVELGGCPFLGPLESCFYGDARTTGLSFVDMAVSSDATGYWLLASDGTVFYYGRPGYGYRYYGSLRGVRLNYPVVAIEADSTNNGYWIFTKDGGVFTFGSARYYGSIPGNYPNLRVNNIVDAKTTGDNNGYWLVGSDGGVFAFGKARYSGSLPQLGISTNNVVGIERVRDSASGYNAYWILAGDGAVFTFPNGWPFFGSGVGQSHGRAVGMAKNMNSNYYYKPKGYWILYEDTMLSYGF